MIVRLQPMRILAWSLVLVMVVLAMGCGHRSSHGSQTHSKKFNKARMSAHQPIGADLTSADGTFGTNGGGEGYFGNGSGTFSDLLDEESLIQEDPQLGDDRTGGGSQNDYWLTRTRAEQFTAQSGLEDVHFAFNSVQLNDQAKTILMANAEWLKAHPDAEVTIEGHCDERGTIAYNLALGERRAHIVKQYLVALGIDTSRLSAISYGEELPLQLGQNEQAWAQNRRAHFTMPAQ